jgi:uncharacterized membrane protein
VATQQGTPGDTPSDPKRLGLDGDGRQTRSVSLGMLWGCLSSGVRDFFAAPVISVLIALVYTVGGWLLIAMLASLNLPYLVYPLAMGFALIAPFVAIAFYAVARFLESGETPTVQNVWAAVWTGRRHDIRWMALMTAFAFFFWIDMAAILTLSFFGSMVLDFDALLNAILTTPEGWTFLVVGHLVGAVIAMAVFSISVVAFPMLFDRDVDIMSAIITSVRLVWRNPITMTIWCGTIAVLTGIALASALFLLPVILPVLGYASWHLYRRAVV